VGVERGGGIQLPRISKCVWNSGGSRAVFLPTARRLLAIECAAVADPLAGTAIHVELQRERGISEPSSGIRLEDTDDWKGHWRSLAAKGARRRLRKRR